MKRLVNMFANNSYLSLDKNRYAMRACVGFTACPKGQLHLQLILSAFPDTPPLLCTLHSSPMHQTVLIYVSKEISAKMSQRHKTYFEDYHESRSLT